MGAVTDDKVIRKRLLIDEDGAGDDCRINLLVKSFIKWCNSGSQEEGYSQYQCMLSTLAQCEFSMGKTLLMELEALGKELEHLSHIKESVEDKLELRRKQFHVLLSTIHELQQTLENDEELSEVEESHETSIEADAKP
ncbi:THO complex subunit 7-like protein [Heterocephalus glaber]|uniref:THO complex subunit 7-like protein n=1 Tax=Heterocephalus glaber TaxID=10181 RepID=G5C229_HETGA|nr:THO complex subunit 7-like protein [Heterocephalus glaber]